MSSEVGFQSRPICNVCNKPVETIEWEYELVEVVGWQDGAVIHQYTGRVFLAVTCHGETWRKVEQYSPPFPWER